MLAELHSHYHDILVPGHVHRKNSDIEFNGIYVTADEGLRLFRNQYSEGLVKKIIQAAYA